MKINRPKKYAVRRQTAAGIIFIFLINTVVGPISSAGAQVLPAPGTAVGLSVGFQPPVLLGLKIHPDNPLVFDFIVDQGTTNLTKNELKAETEKLVKYFLAALTIPDKEVWVNLSPTEKDRIIPDILSQTIMGKTMLEQDYILKQLASSLTDPNEKLGQDFWAKVKGKTRAEQGITEVPMNTFNKVWIVPQKAEVLESNGIVIVGEKKLKVMMSEDYQSLDSQTRPTAKADISSEVFRSVILPHIEKEVNEGKNFANVRQIYNSVILAAWYKQVLKESLLGKVYADKGKVSGVETDDKEMKQRIYEQYLAAFKKGVYNVIKEDLDASTGEAIPRKYFSGGEALDASKVLGRSQVSLPAIEKSLSASSSISVVTVFAAENDADQTAVKTKVASGSSSIEANDFVRFELYFDKKVKETGSSNFEFGADDVVDATGMDRDIVLLILKQLSNPQGTFGIVPAGMRFYVSNRSKSSAKLLELWKLQVSPKQPLGEVKKIKGVPGVALNKTLDMRSLVRGMLEELNKDPNYIGRDWLMSRITNRTVVSFIIESAMKVYAARLTENGMSPDEAIYGNLNASDLANIQENVSDIILRRVNGFTGKGINPEQIERFAGMAPIDRLKFVLRKIGYVESSVETSPGNLETEYKPSRILAEALKATMMRSSSSAIEEKFEAVLDAATDKVLKDVDVSLVTSEVRGFVRGLLKDAYVATIQEGVSLFRSAGIRDGVKFYKFTDWRSSSLIYLTDPKGFGSLGITAINIPDPRRLRLEAEVAESFVTKIEQVAGTLTKAVSDLQYQQRARGALYQIQIERLAYTILNSANALSVDNFNNFISQLERDLDLREINAEYIALIKGALVKYQGTDPASGEVLSAAFDDLQSDSGGDAVEFGISFMNYLIEVFKLVEAEDLTPWARGSKDLDLNALDLASAVLNADDIKAAVADFGGFVLRFAKDLSAEKEPKPILDAMAQVPQIGQALQISFGKLLGNQPFSVGVTREYAMLLGMAHAHFSAASSALDNRSLNFIFGAASYTIEKRFGQPLGEDELSSWRREFIATILLNAVESAKIGESWFQKVPLADGTNVTGFIVPRNSPTLAEIPAHEEWLKAVGISRIDSSAGPALQLSENFIKVIDEEGSTLLRLFQHLSRIQRTIANVEVQRLAYTIILSKDPQALKNFTDFSRALFTRISELPAAERQSGVIKSAIDKLRAQDPVIGAAVDSGFERLNYSYGIEGEVFISKYTAFISEVVSLIQQELRRSPKQSRELDLRALAVAHDILGSSNVPQTVKELMEFTIKFNNELSKSKDPAPIQAAIAEYPQFGPELPVYFEDALKNNSLAGANAQFIFFLGMVYASVGAAASSGVSEVVKTSAPVVEEVGGIDFDPANMHLQIKRDGKGVPLPLPQQNVEQINIQGLFPVIINIQPVNAETLPLLLGQAPKEPARDLESTSKSTI